MLSIHASVNKYNAELVIKDIYDLDFILLFWVLHLHSICDGNMSLFDISVIILVYNPDLEKLKRTICSVMNQKNVKMQIVISDDGSSLDSTAYISTIFDRYSFNNYKIIRSLNNTGTVLNFRRALEVSDGIYCKGISPGDELVGPYDLSNWIHFLKINKAQVSFGNAIYYRMNPNNSKKIYLDDVLTAPIFRYIYEPKKYNYKAILINQFILNDHILGCTFISNTKLTMKYIMEISNKVIYMEDGIFKLMIADNIKVYYYAHDVIYYEYGSGISTNGSDFWLSKLQRDNIALNKLLYGKTENVFFNNYEHFVNNNSSNVFFKALNIIRYYPQALKWKIKQRFEIIIGRHKVHRIEDIY